MEALGRAGDALGYLLPIIEQERTDEAGADPTELAHRCGRLLVRTGDDARAADLLGRARKQVATDDPLNDPIADDLFAVLYRLGRTVEARDLARRTAADGAPSRRATWLVRSAQLSETAPRLQLLREADSLLPGDAEVADALEAALRAADEFDELERHL